jgi:hypothetical protein
VIFMAALLAPEHRLALAVPGRGVAARMTLLRGETRINAEEGDPDAAAFCSSRTPALAPSLYQPSY